MRSDAAQTSEQELLDRRVPAVAPIPLAEAVGAAETSGALPRPVLPTVPTMPIMGPTTSIVRAGSAAKAYKLVPAHHQSRPPGRRKRSGTLGVGSFEGGSAVFDARGAD
jgi:hypothetical protein